MFCDRRALKEQNRPGADAKKTTHFASKYRNADMHAATRTCVLTHLERASNGMSITRTQSKLPNTGVSMREGQLIRIGVAHFRQHCPGFDDRVKIVELEGRDECIPFECAARLAIGGVYSHVVYIAHLQGNRVRVLLLLTDPVDVALVLGV